MRRLIPIVAGVLLSLFQPMSAAEESKEFSLEGWVPESEIDKAMSFAKEKDRGLVFMYLPRAPKADQIKLAEAWGRDGALGGMVKVIAHTDTRGVFEKIRTQVTDAGKETPRLYFTTPDLKLTGFVAAREPRRLRRVAGLAGSVDAWRRGAAADIEKADALADQGRYGAALKIITAIHESDLKHTAMVQDTWKSLPAVVEKDNKDAKDKKPKNAEAPKPAEEPAAASTQPKGEFFPTLLDERTGAYKSKAAERLSAARKHMAESQPQEARKLLAPLAADGAGFDEQTEARKLLAEISAATATGDAPTEPSPPENAE